MKFTLHPIYWIADRHVDREPFDQTILPFKIVDDVSIERLTERFRPGTFDHGTIRHGSVIKQDLESVHHALVHRYEPEGSYLRNGQWTEDQSTKKSEQLVRGLMACLRLIRPMRSKALLMKGNVRDDGSFDVMSYDVPPQHLIEVPENQKLFKLRTRDCHDLRAYAPGFLRAMPHDTGVWKFKMAIQFHELGHFQALDWKARYLLWASAIESIFTTNSRNHQGTLVAMERMKWFLGANTSIYPAGELSEFDPDPHLTVRDIARALYNVRNQLAHGDRIPDLYFSEKGRDGINGPVAILWVLLEAASFVIRHSLLRILGDGLETHFTDATASESYFDSQDLTGPKLRAAKRAARP